MSLPDLIWKICILATFFSETIPKISLLIEESGIDIFCDSVNNFKPEIWSLIFAAFS